jgi:hypothetical protein
VVMVVLLAVIGLNVLFNVPRARRSRTAQLQ